MYFGLIGDKKYLDLTKNNLYIKIMLDNADDVVNNEVENPELVKEVDIVEYDTEVEVKIKTSEMKEGEMIKDEMKPEVQG